MPINSQSNFNASRFTPLKMTLVPISDFLQLKLFEIKSCVNFCLILCKITNFNDEYVLGFIFEQREWIK